MIETFGQSDHKLAVVSDVLPAKTKPKRRGPQKKPPKERITIRLPASVVDAFRDSGKNWQTLIGQILQEWLDNHPL